MILTWHYVDLGLLIVQSPQAPHFIPECFAGLRRAPGTCGAGYKLVPGHTTCRSTCKLTQWGHDRILDWYESVVRINHKFEYWVMTHWAWLNWSWIWKFGNDTTDVCGFWWCSEFRGWTIYWCYPIKFNRVFGSQFYTIAKICCLDFHDLCSPRLAGWILIKIITFFRYRLNCDQNHHNASSAMVSQNFQN